MYSLLANPVLGIVAGLFCLWMMIDAGRRGEWMWVVFMFIFPFCALYYYFSYYRGSSGAAQGFELPGASHRKRIKELQRLIHDLDKAHHYLELGDIYFRKGKFSEAEKNYRASLERDPQDVDARAHFGQCLLRQNRAAEARPILQQVCAENPKHDYGHSLMAFAETLGALGEIDNAIAIWKQVLQDHGYARARTQLGELYLRKGERELANAEFREVISDDKHAPLFQRRRDRVWVRRAKKSLV